MTAHHPWVLRSQWLSDPGRARAREPDAFVQAVVAVLPELDRIRLEQVAAPALGPRHLAERQLRLELRLQRPARLDRLALPRRGGGGLRTWRSCRPVGVRL